MLTVSKTMFGFQIFFCIFFLGSVCFGEQTYISKWIETDSKYSWNIYVFKTVLNKGLNHCVEECKARKNCEYINFEIRTRICYLIGVNVIDGGTLNGHNERIHTKQGYVFGKKEEWNMVRH